MKPLHIITSLIVLFCLSVTAQNHVNCGSDAAHNSYIEKHPEAKELFKLEELSIQKHIAKGLVFKSSEEVYRVPLVIHVMHLGEAEGFGSNISDAQIQSGIDQLNAAYRNSNGLGIDMGIEFALAVQDPDGVSTDGILRYDASGIANYSASGISISNGAGADEVTLKATSKWPRDQYYNIWIVTEINGNGGAGGIQGFAYIPGASDDIDGTVVQNTAWGSEGTVNNWNDLGATIVHELGHGLGLYHTFHVQDAADTTANGCPINTDCSTQGDLCCDTDPHIVSASNSCDTAAINPCTGVKFGNVVRNYMDYSDDECQVMFSADQKDRMRGTLEGPRKGLLSSKALDAVIAPCDIPIAANCTPQTGPDGLSGSIIGIGTIEITGKMSNTSSTAAIDGGYVDNTSNCITTCFLNPDSTYTVSITPANGDNPYYSKIWIDYNDNGDFDNDELIFAEADTFLNVSTANFTVPNTVTQNKFLRLRAMIDAIEPISDACTGPKYGQAEDYTVYFHIPSLVTSDIKESMGVHELSVFPNPTEDILNVKFDYSNNEELNLLVRDIQGRLIINQQLVSSMDVITQIDVSNFNKGIYSLSIQNNKGATTQNFIVK